MAAPAEKAKLMQFDDGPRSKRLAILNAAVASFGEVGYEATKWSTVADRVGIGQTALYHYFESKAHCLLTIIRVELERSHDRFEAAIGGETSCRKQLRAVVDAAFDLSEQEVRQLRILQSNFSILANVRNSPAEEGERLAARERTHQIELDWQALLQRGMDTGEFRKQNTRLGAEVVLGMIVSVWRWYRPDGPLTLHDVRDYVYDACRRLTQKP
jgi:AcrR family transcriptional regulator